MADYYYGTGKAGATRNDLGQLADRWTEEFLGPDGRYVAHRAMAQADIPGAGSFLFPKRDNVVLTDGGNSDYRRAAGGAIPQRDPGKQEDLTLKPVDYGQEAVWDESGAIVRKMLADPAAGLGAVEELFLRQSLASCHEGCDRDLFALLAANTGLKVDGTTNSDVDATATKWTAATTDIVSQFATAERNLGTSFDAVLLDFTAATHFKASEEMFDRFGGNVGAGGMTWEQFKVAMATMSRVKPDNVFVGEPGLGLSTNVVCFIRGGVGPVDPMTTPSALIAGTVREPDGNELGISVRTRDIDHRRHGVYAFWPGAIAIRRQYYVRITNVY